MEAINPVISSPELRRILGERPESITLLDVREPEEFAESRIEGCVLIPLGELMNRAEQELDKDSEIIIYCAHGVRSMYALRGLQSLGFQNCKSLTGGICEFYP
jgi:sulfur-carrier protein adenylyltransferase/sulfurtransferase